jgi:hypothetical protein
MEMTTSSISVLWLFVQRHEFLLDVTGGVGRSNLLRYDLLDLALPDRSRMVFVDFHEEVCPCNIYLGCYVLGNGNLYSRSSATLTRQFGSYSLKYWCSYSCRYLLITQIATPVYVALAQWLKLKL